MTRVGLYLALRPEAGGAYQYSLTMLDAVAALPRSQYTPVAVCAHDGWKALADARGLESVLAIPGRAFDAAAYVWRKSGAPLSAWRKVAPQISPYLRRLAALRRDIWIYPAQDPMAYLLPQPALAAVHDLMHRYEGQFPEVSGFRMRELHYKATCRYATGVLVDSETGKRQLVESYGIEPSRAYPLPYVPPAYMQATDDPPRFETRYALPRKFFFYPAQFWEHKNHVRLLKAVHALSSSAPDMRLVFVGAKKNGYDAIMRVAGELQLSSRVQVLDYVPNEDMPALYRRARALVMPTFFGPTNIPPLEAMTVGCPVAISGTYGMREQSGDAALYFDPSSVDEIAGCLARLWSDDALCATLAARGSTRVAGLSQGAFNARLAEILTAAC